MGIQIKNNAEGFLATAISASDTGIVLTTGNGASFPALGASDYFYATLESTGGTFEVIKVTVRSGDSMTVVRAQEGSTANSFAAGSRIELRVTAQSVLDAVDQVTAAQVGVTPYGWIAATNVQDALEEVVDDLDAALVSYDPPFTNSVATNVETKLAEYVSVLDFGADSTGAMPSQNAIQAAIDEVEANGGGSIYFPEGVYLLTTGITVLANDVSLIFDTGASINWAGSATGTIITVSNGTDQFRNNIENLRITHTTVMTGGTALKLDAVNTFNINNIQINGAFNAISLSGGAGVIQNVQLTNSVAGGTVVDLISVGDFYLENGTIQGPIGAQPAYAILVRKAAICNIKNIDAFQSGEGLRVDPAGPDAVDHLNVNECHFEGGTYGITLVGAGAINWARINNTGTAINQFSGIYVAPTVANSVHFYGCYAYLNGLRGMHLVSGIYEDVIIESCVFTGNSQTTSGLYSGLSANGGLNNYRVTNCRSGQISGLGGTSPNSQYAGFDIGAGGNSNIIVVDNDFRVNVSATFIDGSTSGTDRIVKDNIGYVTSNGGVSSSIASGDTIAHGLSTTPKYVTVVPISGSGATDLTVSFNATNITVAFGGGVNTQFSWSASA